MMALNDDGSSRSRWPVAFILALLLCGMFSVRAGAQNRRISIDSVRVEHDTLLVDFHVDSLLTSQLLNGMQRGLTSAVRIRVELWRRRGWLLGALVSEREYEIKSAFDPWEKKYLVQTAEERRWTRSVDFVRASWEQKRNVALEQAEALQPKSRYYLAIEIQLEPVSRETLSEIRGWLSGEVKSLTGRDSVNAAEAHGLGGLRDRLLETAIDLTGFGKRVFSMKSKTFRVGLDKTIEFEE